LTIYFNTPNNLEDLRQRILAEMEQISLDIIERSVQSVGDCQIVGGTSLVGQQGQLPSTRKIQNAISQCAKRKIKININVKLNYSLTNSSCLIRA
jgi:hypothetical protein